jgi:hypothetical protein
VSGDRPAIRPHLSSFDPDAFVRPVDRFVWKPVRVPHPGPVAERPLAGRRLLLLGESAALVDGVAGELTRRGGRVVRCAAGDALGRHRRPERHRLGVPAG